MRTGSIVAGYRVISLVGEGAMGAVYLAEASDGVGRVALKVLSPELRDDERFRKRFLRESQLAAALDHPHVVPTLGSGEEDGVLYLAMAYIEGFDLRQLLRREGMLEPQQALDLVDQVGQALDAAHASGLIHRDVKPGNVLIRQDVEGPHAFICDFGLARHVSSVSSLTGERGFVGTIDYVSPEQIEGHTVDSRSDIYSLACVLYECIAGTRPFERESELSVVFAHLVEPVSPITDHRPDLPPGLDDVFSVALAKSPEDRYTTCRELVEAARGALAGQPVRRRTSPGRRRRVVVGGVAAGAAAAIGGAVLLALTGSPSKHSPVAARTALGVKPDAVALVDASSLRPRASLRFHSVPSTVAFGRRADWIVLPDEQRVVRVDPSTRRITGRVTLPFAPEGIASVGDSAWVTEEGGSRVVRISGRPDGGVAIAQRLSVTARGRRAGTPSGIAVGAGSLWLTRGAQIVRVDPHSGHVIGRFANFVTARLIQFQDGAVWGASSDSGEIVKIDPATNQVVATAHLRGWVSDLAVGGGFVWVAVVPSNVVYKLSVNDLSLQQQLAGGTDPESVSLGGGSSVWVANTNAGTVTRFDAAGTARRTIRLTSQPVVARYHQGFLWIAAAPAQSPLPPVPNGQEIRIPLSSDDVNFDPAAPANADRFQRDYATCATLLNYPDSDGAAGRRLRPEIAAALPSLSSDGRTYTFRIRPGFRFSPPSGEAVTAETFRHTFERALSPAYGAHSPGMQLLSNIVGATAYNAGEARHVTGIRARGDELSITLRKPEGDFESHLSEAFFCPVPLGTRPGPGGVARALPTAGPYYIASHTPERTVLLRNPNYHGSRPRRPERIVYSVGATTAKAVALVGGGAAEYMDGYTSDSDPTVLFGDSDIARRYGPNSAAARNGRQRYFVIPVPAVDMIAFNTRRPLFHDVRMRRAVSFAIDRRALADVYHEQAVDRFIPPAVAGYRPEHVYPLRPDLARARKLAGPGRHRAVVYECGDPIGLDVLRLLRSQLDRIGITLTFDESTGCLNGPETAKLARADLVLVSQFDEWGDPAGTIDASLGTPYSVPGVDDPALSRAIDQARPLRGQARVTAYARLDDRLLHTVVPFAAYGGFTTAEYFSPRVGCKVFQATYHFVDLGALCVRPA